MKIFNNIHEIVTDARIMILRERPELASITRYVATGLVATMCHNEIDVMTLHGEKFNPRGCHMSKDAPRSVLGLVLPPVNEMIPTGYVFQVHMEINDYLTIHVDHGVVEAEWWENAIL